MQIRGLSPRGQIERAIVALRHASPAFNIVYRRQSRLARLAKALGVELIWFVGGFSTRQIFHTSQPFGDVQHLMHPWFPEVSADGRWAYRELLLATHLRRATFVITGAQIGRDQLLHYYRLTADRIHILPHPTPAFALRAPTAAGDADRPFGLSAGYLLYPAQFWPHKNHVNLLHALHVLRGRRDKLPMLVLVGLDRCNRAHVERCIDELGFRDSVRIL